MHSKERNIHLPFGSAPRRESRKTFWLPRFLSPRFRVVLVANFAVLIGALFFTAPLRAQPVVLNDPATLTAAHGISWTQGDDRFVLLQSVGADQAGAGVRVGTMGFSAKQALVRVRRSGVPGARRFDLAVVLDKAEALPGNAGQDDAASGVSASGSRLLVTASTRGGVVLQVDALNPSASPPKSKFLSVALRRLDRYDAQQELAMSSQTPPIELDAAQQKKRDAVAAQVRARRTRLTAQALDRPGPPDELVADARHQAQNPPPDPGVLPARGSVSYAPGSIVIDRNDDETIVSLLDGVSVIFEDHATGRTVSLRAQRAVLFVANTEQGGDAGTDLSGGQIDAGKVRGVYLEDNAIITDGDYTVRAPRVYYDLRENRAVLLEAVMFTYDLKRRVPLYLRADVLRQTAAASFVAHNARFTTSDFHEPHVALGAGRIEISQYETPTGQIGHSVDATDVTLRVREVPVLYWPRFAARGTDTPLRRVKAGYNSHDGPTVETKWDLFSLIGKEEPQGVNADLILDFLGEHGPGVGTEIDYDRDDMFGHFNAYALLSDSGDDNLPQRADIDHASDTRGYALLQHRQNFPNGIDLSVEAGYASDETFLEEFFPSLAEERKPFETSIYLDRREEESQFTALLKADVNDFLPQLSALQTPGYTVDRLPEIAYRRVGTPVFDGAATWYSENTASVLRISAGDDSPADRGFNNAQSLATFGIANTTSFDAAANAVGLPDGQVLRADTRQEIAVPLEAGGWNITPFVVGRITAYDDGFEDFNGGNDDKVRLWGQLGTRVSTEFSKVYGNVSNRVLDLDGIRHIVEPHATVAWSEASINAEELPVFDFDVESITQGGTFKLGINQTFQTRRGGPGRQRTVDWIKLNTYVVFQTEDALDAEPLGRFDDYRPEYARGGDHFYTELLWQLSDAVGAVGEITYDLEDDKVSQWRLGGELRHTPRLSTFVSYEEIDHVDSALLTWGMDYQLTTKYRVAAAQTLDFSGNERRQLSLALERRLPRFRFLATASWDQLEDEQSFGFVLIPEGFGNGRGLGSGLFN